MCRPDRSSGITRNRSRKQKSKIDRENHRSIEVDVKEKMKNGSLEKSNVFKSYPDTVPDNFSTIRGALPLGSSLEIIGLTTNTECIFCGAKELTDLLLSCPLATNVWTMTPISNAHNISSSPTFISALQASHKLTNLPPHWSIPCSSVPLDCLETLAN
ncbi:hypothetical protein YC2023_023276 [Brassica napus]